MSSHFYLKKKDASGYLRWLSYDFRDHFIEDIISMADEDEKIEVAVENVCFSSFTVERLGFF